LYRAAANATEEGSVDDGVLSALGDDLNTPNALARLHELARQANKGDAQAAANLKMSARLMGLLQAESSAWFQGGAGDDDVDINAAITARNEAKARKDYVEADRIRDDLMANGIALEDGPEGTIWRRI
jgi:cysteinyl-tRNA synthetase